MAQNFKSKDLTISIPEKAAEQPQETHIMPTPTACGCTHVTNPCIGFTLCGFSPICHVFSMCHGYSPIISPGTCTTTPVHCTPTPHVCTPTPHVCTPTPCTISITEPTIQTVNEISKVTDVETLNTLKEKLANTLKEVEAQHAAVSKAK